MAKGYKHGAGGVGLNFKVICNPQPETAKENTIWVNTDRINNYYFSAEQPENMVEYDVWFSIYTYSNVEFNALKKNGIQVYPISAKQYIGGALVGKEAKSFSGGEWVDWGYGGLFNHGNLYELVTGGWTPLGWTHSGRTLGGTATIGETLDLGVTVASTFSALGTVNKIDLTDFNTISAEGSSTGNGYMMLSVSQTKRVDGGYEADNSFNPSYGSVNLDLSSLSGEWYVIVYQINSHAGGTRNTSYTRIWMK